ncbi:MAG: flagellar hook assembly protein FlgD [Asticcacaulis sp.]
MVSPVTNTPSATSQSATAVDTAALTGNYTTFLNLLTAQIKNQDPLSPMDTTQWTNQLVQYSSVEQQLKANGYLEQLANANTANSMNAAVSYIGKTVSADQPNATLANGSANWDYALAAPASDATLTISDAQGNTVWSDKAPDLTKGLHTFTWDGKTSSGQQLPDGDYTLKITATNGTTAIDAGVGVSGVVTSALSDGTSVVLKVGNTSVPLASVTKVS